ncbi:hypothetical protein AGDE_05134 [Angomonas deanei]|nr:hypothetical protein AGDE_05134 [Angomonas deanei]|eukprot:EPY38795.1 hypothetical protein AGDE_05134 [Angomonas deanei]
MKRLFNARGLPGALALQQKWGSRCGPVVPLLLPRRLVSSGVNIEHNSVPQPDPPSSTIPVKTASELKHQSDLIHHVRLLNRIADSGDSVGVIQKRLRGLLRVFEASFVEWLTVETSHEEELQAVCIYVLMSFAKIVHFMKVDNECKKGEKGLFSDNVVDALNMCLMIAVQGEEDKATLHALFHCAVTLFLDDTKTLRGMVAEITSKEYCASLSSDALVSLLRDISLSMKRGKLPLVPVHNLLFLLPSVPLTARENLSVLSSLLRMKGVKTVEAVSLVSRKGAKDVLTTYNAKDVVFGLEVVAYLDGCHPEYASAVLSRCAEVARVMDGRQLGMACKYIALLNDKRATNKIGVQCAKEVRRVLPPIVERAEELLGQFTFQDARYVVRCLSEHHQKHSIVLSKLSPVVSR